MHFHCTILQKVHIFELTNIYDIGNISDLFMSVENSIVISGEPSPDNLTNVRQWKHHRLLTSPFFPSLYPRDIATEYVLKCNESSSCRIRVLFTDFQISVLSTMEVIFESFILIIYKCFRYVSIPLDVYIYI